MATARSFTGLNWLVRIYAPSLLTACGRTADASQLSTLAQINSTARINAAITRINTLETQLKGQYGPAWDAHWSEALEYVIAQVDAQSPVPRAEMFTDADQTVKQSVKTTMRGLELVACKFLADGGVLP